MTIDTISSLVCSHLPFSPTDEQMRAIALWSRFLVSRSQRGAFLLRGYAGTGKSSLVGGMVKTLAELKLSMVLLAPTGRAAKVMSHYAGQTAYTIHKHIYRQKSFVDNVFSAGVNLKPHTLFIVDEASMIANRGLAGAMFGTGCLLDDLVEFVYSSTGCRLMLVGDTAQLPPVEEAESPALSQDILAGYGLDVLGVELTEVLRQRQASGILYNATVLRQVIGEGYSLGHLPQFRLSGFADIRRISGSELIESLENSYYHCGKDQTIVVTRSNKWAYRYNMGIRTRILNYEEEISGGDLLMVSKNNYYWCRNERELPFVANGDVAEVCRFRNERSLYGFRFADATLRFPDYDDLELETTILLDTLASESAALPREDQERLFQEVWADYADIRSKAERAKRLKEDPYYNALQVKYAYAVTCHKAQGGQWQHVYVEQGYVAPEMLTEDYLRWLYTALTRATERIFLVNWPKEQIEPE